MRCRVKRKLISTVLVLDAPLHKTSPAFCEFSCCIVSTTELRNADFPGPVIHDDGLLFDCDYGPHNY